MVAVYAIEPLTNSYQQLEYDEWPVYDAVWDTDEAFFNGNPIGDRWQPPEVYVREPSLDVPNIWCGPDVVFTFDGHAVNILRSILEESGESLPLPYEGGTMFTLNPTAWVDCLDMENTVCDPRATFLIDQYVFLKEKLGPNLFMTPQTRAPTLLTVEGLQGPEREFKPLVENYGLSGLWFRQLWSSDDK